MIAYDERYAAPLRRLEEPPGEAVLIIGLGDPIDVVEPSGLRRTLRTFAVPIGTEPSFVEQAGHQAGIEVRLSPLVARGLLGVPLHELSPHGTELDELIGRRARELVERVADAGDPSARAEIVREFLAAAPAPRPELVWAWRRLHDPRPRVGDIAREVGWSRRHLLTRFRDAVGVTPKEAARVLRFRRAIAGIRRGATLADAGFDAGYADQAHMSREFRELAGCTPGQFPFVQDGDVTVA